MPIKKRPPLPASPIDPETLSFAVTGETAEGSSFLEFDRTPEQWVDFWTQHEALLRAEAQRRGLSAPWVVTAYPHPRRQGRT